MLILEKLSNEYLDFYIWFLAIYDFSYNFNALFSNLLISNQNFSYFCYNIYSITYRLLDKVLEMTSFKFQAFLISKELKRRENML
jgi:hypothetical protein